MILFQKKNDKNKQLEDKIKGLQEYIDSFGKEVKWNQNQIAQKENTVKLMKDKLKKKDEEILSLQKKIEELSKKNNKPKNQISENKNNNINQNYNYDDYDDEEVEQKEILIPVKAKPNLFGPEKTEIKISNNINFNNNKSNINNTTNNNNKNKKKSINFFEGKENKKPYLFGPETFNQEDNELDQVIFNS